MEWMIVLRTLRNIRKSNIPLKLGYNCFLYSPKIKNGLDKGWRIQICNNLTTEYLDKIRSIVKNIGLDVGIMKEDCKYIEIFNNDNYETIDLQIDNKIIL